MAAQEDKKTSGAPSVGQVVSRAVIGPLNLGVVGAAAIGAAALHSWPIAALGGVAYAAMVAWDVVNPKFWKKANAVAARPELPSPSSLQDPQSQETLRGILAAREELERVLEETPEQVKSHLAMALVQLSELEDHAGRLIARSEELHRYLAKTNPEPVRREAARLADKARSARDPEARAQYESAHAARQEQLRALDDIADSKDRVAANLSRIAATLGAMPAKVVRMRALDAQAMDSLTGDLNQELESVNGEIRTFEETLKSLAEIAT